MTAREMFRIKYGHPGIFLVLRGVKEFPDVVKVAQKRESSPIQIEDVRVRHSTSQIGRNPRHMHLTEGCVCGSMFNMVARVHMYPAQCNAAAEQQPEGWRMVDPPPCLGGSTHRWVPVDTHSTPVSERDGCGWPM